MVGVPVVQYYLPEDGVTASLLPAGGGVSPVEEQLEGRVAVLGVLRGRNTGKVGELLNRLRSLVEVVELSLARGHSLVRRLIYFLPGVSLGVVLVVELYVEFRLLAFALLQEAAIVAAVGLHFARVDAG